MRAFLSRLAIVLALAVVFGTAIFHYRSIGGSLPYPQHPDEKALIQASARVLQTGNLNPGMYSYPALPVYLGTAGLALGMIRESGHGPHAVQMHNLGRLVPPYYEHVLVAATVRTLWWAMGLVTMLAVSVIALRLSGPAGMLLAAAVQAAGVAVPGRSTGYLNVDTPMTMFAMTCLAFLVSSRDSRWPLRVGVPALLCGAAIASKYTAVVLLVPCLAAQWLFYQRDRGWASITFAFGALLSFAAFCPYFVLDLPHYVDGVAFENYHYRVRGHSGFDIEPGWAQFSAYVTDLTQEYGEVLVAIAAVGVLDSLRVSFRRSVIVLGYVVVVTIMLVGYKVHFVRNGLPLMALVPVFAAAGLLALWLLARTALRRVRQLAAAPRADLVAATVPLLIVAIAAPWHRVREVAEATPDARNAVIAWAAKQFREETTLVVPTQLPFDARGLPSQLRVQPLDLADARAAAETLTAGTLFVLPEWTDRGGWRGRRMKDIAAGRAAIPPHDTLVRFGRERVVPAQGEEVVRNPSLGLVRIR